ncbi:Holliday junction branch migration protein RuvA [Bartonella sp. F02]|uniref:Holliday junction branch migration protein RuvA n=1 Tax=Bartonella sp. F02 TaxID=2967262 RepID=UPI0022A8FC86|nr:Holliday junction branch migration protein RuvA [Bartonella sp. F02]MCZ2328825.1 Holliday junction branch migration protein RuvA [Bartonella sp. F02]
MIGKLKGILEEVCDDHIIVDIHGVGYVVFIPNRLRFSLPEIGEKISLFIETHVREDAIRLFGFSTQSEQNYFCLLQNVPGVGAKVALAVLGTLSIDELTQAITLGDIAMISRTPGVGKKVSQRIVSELKSKVLPFNESNTSQRSSAFTSEATSQLVNDALLALMNLGFERDQAANAIAVAKNELGEETISSALLIRHSLKLLSSQNTR